MTSQDNEALIRDMQAMPGFEKFIDRLESGMEIEGRIIDVLAENIFILRVWGSNIIAESNHPFRKFSEVILHVRAVKPKLVFTMRPSRPGTGGALYA